MLNHYGFLDHILIIPRSTLNILATAPVPTAVTTISTTTTTLSTETVTGGTTTITEGTTTVTAYMVSIRHITTVTAVTIAQSQTTTLTDTTTVTISTTTTSTLLDAMQPRAISTPTILLALVEKRTVSSQQV
jgi:hypothetical protein